MAIVPKFRAFTRRSEGSRAERQAGLASAAWAIVGEFDRPWFKRPLRQIRSMSAASIGREHARPPAAYEHFMEPLFGPCVLMYPIGA